MAGIINRLENTIKELKEELELIYKQSEETLESVDKLRTKLAELVKKK